MIRVARIRQETAACPAHWRGVTEDGEVFDAHFLKGVLNVGIVETKNSLIPRRQFKQVIYTDKISSELDGWISYNMLQELLKHTVELPQEHRG